MQSGVCGRVELGKLIRGLVSAVPQRCGVLVRYSLGGMTGPCAWIPAGVAARGGGG